MIPITRGSGGWRASARHGSRLSNSEIRRPATRQPQLAQVPDNQTRLAHDEIWSSDFIASGHSATPLSSPAALALNNHRLKAVGLLGDWKSRVAAKAA